MGWPRERAVVRAMRDEGWEERAGSSSSRFVERGRRFDSRLSVFFAHHDLSSNILFWIITLYVVLQEKRGAFSQRVHLEAPNVVRT